MAQSVNTIPAMITDQKREMHNLLRECTQASELLGSDKVSIPIECAHIILKQRPVDWDSVVDILSHLNPKRNYQLWSLVMHLYRSETLKPIEECDEMVTHMLRKAAKRYEDNRLPLSHILIREIGDWCRNKIRKLTKREYDDKR